MVFIYDKGSANQDTNWLNPQEKGNIQRYRVRRLVENYRIYISQRIAEIGYPSVEPSGRRKFTEIASSRTC